jgi:putative nucleotidyltransferase with HDIG domain
MRKARLGAGGELRQKFLGLLVMATWLPLVLLSWTSLNEYESRLALESASRLADRTKAAGLQIFRRLDSLRSDLAVAAFGLPPGDGAVDLLAERPRWRDRFATLAVMTIPDALSTMRVPPLEPDTRSRWLDGSTALLVDEAGPSSAIWLVSPLEGAPSRGVWAEVRLGWIWPESTMDTGEELWLLFASDRRRPIAASPGIPDELLAGIAAASATSSGGFEWLDAAGRKLQARFWTVPLGYEFGYPGLTILVSEPSRLEEAVAGLRRILFLLALGSLLLIALLGIRRLRSDLGPLEKLAEGARLMASGEFGTRVETGRRDEIGKLSEAFNRMGDELERRFHQIEGTRNIAASALLAAPDFDAVARVFVEQAQPLVGDLEVVVAPVSRSGSVWKVVSMSRSPRPPEKVVEGLRIAMAAEPVPGDGWLTGGPEAAWRLLRRGDSPLAVVGVFGAKESPRDSQVALLNGACDQLALALAHLDLLEDLERANWGALTALARAVDAKSPWTHGHSIRVSEIAAAIASEIGHSETEVQRIRRGCLVHDVGKIGVPSAVLDKPGALTAADVSMLRSHVEKGVRILQPIEGLADVLPMVWQHHERLDGSGYPRGLAGDAIDPAAALVAVADVFEALTVSRPYRPAWTSDRAMEHLRDLAGTQFDARYVEALARVRGRYQSWPEGA